MLQTKKQEILEKLRRMDIGLYVFVFLLIVPNIAWIFMDNHVWPWDSAWYGQVSVDLYYQSTQSFSAWWHLMMHAFGIKAPAIAWFGQLFIPLSGIFGSIDRALLMFVLGVQFFTLVLLYKLLLRITKNDKGIALIGCISMASAPLFIGMGNQYFVESLQIFTVIAFLYIFVAMKTWNKYDVILSLLFIAPFAMIVKITAPLYIFLPALFMLPRLKTMLQQSTITAREYFGKIGNIVLYVLGSVLLFATISWYIENWTIIYSFMQLASSGSAAELYGSRAPFFDKLLLWLSFSQKSFFFPITVYFVGALAGLYCFKLYTQKTAIKLKSVFSEIPFISIASLVLILVFFSFQINEETRYLLPALPYLIILLCWFVYRIANDGIRYATLTVFLIQFIVVQGISLNLIGRYKEDVSVWITAPYTDMARKNTIYSILDQTCVPESINMTNMIGVELPYMNANSISYYASQEKLNTNRTCYYTSLGYAESDTDKAMKRMNDLKPPYFVGVSADKLPTNDAFNAVSLSSLEAIEKSLNFSEIKLQTADSVRIFKNVSAK